MRRGFAWLIVMACLGFGSTLLSAQESVDGYSFRVLATNKTSTMQKEMNEAADAGYRFEKAMGGNTLGGSEVVVIMSKNKNAPAGPRYAYKLLATNKTSTMQKELQEVGEEGFDYKLLATTKTSTMQKELQEAGDSGFKFVGVTVSKTAFGGKEIVSILRKEVAK